MNKFKDMTIDEAWDTIGTLVAETFDPTADVALMIIRGDVAEKDIKIKTLQDKFDYLMDQYLKFFE